MNPGESLGRCFLTLFPGMCQHRGRETVGSRLCTAPWALSLCGHLLAATPPRGPLASVEVTERRGKRPGVVGKAWLAFPLALGSLTLVAVVALMSPPRLPTSFPSGF